MRHALQALFLTLALVLVFLLGVGLGGWYLYHKYFSDITSEVTETLDKIEAGKQAFEAKTSELEVQGKRLKSIFEKLVF